LTFLGPFVASPTFCAFCGPPLTFPSLLLTKAVFCFFLLPFGAPGSIKGSRGATTHPSGISLFPPCGARRQSECLPISNAPPRSVLLPTPLEKQSHLRVIFLKFSPFSCCALSPPFPISLTKLYISSFPHLCRCIVLIGSLSAMPPSDVPHLHIPFRIAVREPVSCTITLSAL